MRVRRRSSGLTIPCDWRQVSNGEHMRLAAMSRFDSPHWKAVEPDKHFSEREEIA